MAEINTTAFKKRLRIDILLKRSEVVRLNTELDEINTKFNHHDTCVTDYSKLNNFRTDLIDKITKAQGELNSLQLKYESLK